MYLTNLVERSLFSTGVWKNYLTKVQLYALVTQRTTISLISYIWSSSSYPVAPELWLWAKLSFYCMTMPDNIAHRGFNIFLLPKFHANKSTQTLFDPDTSLGLILISENVGTKIRKFYWKNPMMAITAVFFWGNVGGDFKRVHFWNTEDSTVGMRPRKFLRAVLRGVREPSRLLGQNLPYPFQTRFSLCSCTFSDRRTNRCVCTKALSFAGG